MRRWFLVALAAGATLLGAAACAPPPADLRWVKATFIAPVVGACYAKPPESTWSRHTNPAVDCATEHYTETAYVGDLPADLNDRVVPPREQPTDEFNTCNEEATNYLGADYRMSNLLIRWVVPSSVDWTLGARWYRCDLVAFDDFVDITSYVTRTEPAKDSLTNIGSSATLQCLTFTDSDNDDSVDEMKGVPCSTSHNAEYAGFTLALGNAYPEGDAMDKVGDACDRVVSKYVGAARREDFLGYIWFIPGRDYWAKGDRSVYCFVAGFDKHTWKGSIKGLGTKKFPK